MQTTRTKSIAAAFAVAGAALIGAAPFAQQPSAPSERAPLYQHGQVVDGPEYTKDGKLSRPLNYREWIFLSSGLGMTYGPLASPGDATLR